MSVEIKVALVSEDQEQQDAFNNPTGQTPPTQQQNPVASTAPAVTLAPGTLNVSLDQLTKVIDNLAKAVTSLDKGKKPPDKADEPKLTEGQQERLARRNSRLAFLDALNGVLPEGQQGGEPKSSGDAPRGSWDKLVRSIDDVIQRGIADLNLSGTTIGRMLSGASRTVANAASTAGGVGRTVLGVGGGTPGGVATAAASGSAASGAAGGAATAGVAAGAGEAAVAGGGAAALVAVVGPAIAVAAALGGAALTVKAFSDKVSQIADEIESFSPQVAGVRAQADANRQFQTLDRAQTVGPRVAQLEAARFRLSESTYEVTTKIYQVALKLESLVPIVEKGLGFVNLLVSTVDVEAAKIYQLLAMLTWDGGKDDAEAAKMRAEADANFAKSAASLLFESDVRNWDKPDPNIEGMLGIDLTGDGKRPQPGGQKFP